MRDPVVVLRPQRARRPAASQVRRRREEARRGRADLASGERRVRESAGRHANRHVKPLGDEIDARVGDPGIERHVGVAQRELGQHVGEHGDREVVRRGQPQHSRR
jgi:hypothetical protein